MADAAHSDLRGWFLVSTGYTDRRDPNGSDTRSNGPSHAGRIAAAVPFVVLREPWTGALLWGSGLTALSAVWAAVGALVAQWVEPRRRAVSVGLALVGAAFVVRVLANSADRRLWLLALTPFGWTERLRAFSDNDWPWLVGPLSAAVLLTAVTSKLCQRRDVGAPLHVSARTQRSSFRLLSSAPAFGWRLPEGALASWASILAVTTFIFALMTGALIDFIDADESYRRLLESMGMDMSVPAIGYLSYIAAFLALPFTAFTGWRIGAARQEEAMGVWTICCAAGWCAGVG